MDLGIQEIHRHFGAFYSECDVWVTAVQVLGEGFEGISMRPDHHDIYILGTENGSPMNIVPFKSSWKLLVVILE